MKKWICLLGIGFISTGTFAQSAEDSVKAIVNKLFDAMRNSDAKMLQLAFGDSAVLQTISVSKEGKVLVKTDAVNDFAKSIVAAPKGSLDERIIFETIMIDANLASVWTPYQFYYNGKLSHCGVNSFQLVRFGNEWKIQYIIDTRRRKGCQ